MIITKDYLNKHKTNKGAYTRKQFQILGIGWPPVKAGSVKLLAKS